MDVLRSLKIVQGEIPIILTCLNKTIDYRYSRNEDKTSYIAAILSNVSMVTGRYSNTVIQLHIPFIRTITLAAKYTFYRR